MLHLHLRYDGTEAYPLDCNSIQTTRVFGPEGGGGEGGRILKKECIVSKASKHTSCNRNAILVYEPYNGVQAILADDAKDAA